MPNGRPRTPSARLPASSGGCGSPIRGARASRRSRRSAGLSGQVTRTSSSWRRRCGTLGCLRHLPAAASTSPSPSAPRSPPSWSSPRYARSGSSRSCPRLIRSRVRRRSRSPRSPMRSSWCSRGRSHRGCTTRSWRSTVAPASSREFGTSHSTPAGTSGSWPRSRPLPWPRKRSQVDFPTGSSPSRSANRPTRSRRAWSGAATISSPAVAAFVAVARSAFGPVPAASR